jgi:hypothetical protein
MPGGPPRRREVLSLVICLVLYGGLLVRANSFTAGGADSSGYLNAARLFAQGRVSERIEILGRLGLPSSDRDVFLPLGYRPGARPDTMAPLYPPGLPLHMAAAGEIAGWKAAPFLTGPLAAVAALALLFLLARELGLSPGFCTAGIVLLASCPIFFGMAVQPMSDVPATAWVLAALLLALRARRGGSAAVVAGAALGVAVLVRPTNALAVFPLALALPARIRSFLAAAIGATPLAGFLLLYDLTAFGKAAETGYGSMLSWTMSSANLLPNLRHYGYWVPVLLSPLVPLGWLLLPLDRRVPLRTRSLLLIWFGSFFAFYCFYQPYEDWWSVRFLLPGIPAMILAALLLTRDIAARLRGRVPSPRILRWTRAAGPALLCAMVLAGVWHIRRFELFSIRAGERVYRDASLRAASAVPERSLIVSMQMSGALKYYTGRPIARWDAIRPERFPELRQAVEERGSRWYALLWPFEEADFRKNLPGRWERIDTVRDIGLWRLD